MQEEFLEELGRCRKEDEQLKKFKDLWEELDQEKKLHVDELRQINCDMNTVPLV